MTAFNFPIDPLDGAVYAPVGGPHYVYRAPAWISQGPSEELLTWSTRAAFVSWVGSSGSLAAGSLYSAANLQYVAVTGSTAIPDLPGLEPFGDVSPEHWKDNTTPLTTPMAVAIQSAANWAMLDSKRRTFKARGRYLVENGIVTPYLGWLVFDLVGAEFKAGPGFALEEDMWTVSGGTGSHGTFWWDGGSFNGEALTTTGPGTAGGGCDVLSISTADSADIVHLYVEEIYTGEDWRSAGGDSHISINGNRCDVYIGHSQGAVDQGVYHTATSNPAVAITEIFRLRGNFVKNQRAAKSARGAAVLDVDITIVDCQSGWGAAPIPLNDGSVPLVVNHTGHVKVVARRTQWPVLAQRCVGVTFDVVATDMGVYLPAVSGYAAYCSEEAHCQFSGIFRCNGRIAVYGINPNVIANGYGDAPDSANFGAIEIRDSVYASDPGASPPTVGNTVVSSYNTFLVHCEGLNIDHTIKESGGATDNTYFVNSHIGNETLLGDSSMMLNTSRFTSSIIAKASNTTSAGLRLPHGTAPSSPTNGDMWTTTAGLFVRVNGVTKQVTLT